MTIGNMVMGWVGPYTIDQLMDNCLDHGFQDLPESNGVYLISHNTWPGEPTRACVPLYVGSNTGRSARFRTRVGDLFADMFGLFTIETGHSSGGQMLYDYCVLQKLNPKKLWLGWIEECSCVRCGENAVYNALHPWLNRKQPPRCSDHGR